MRPARTALAAIGLLGVLHTAPLGAETLASASTATVSVGGAVATGDKFTTGTSGGIEGPTLSDYDGLGGVGDPLPPNPPPPPPKDYWPDCFICD